MQTNRMSTDQNCSSSVSTAHVSSSTCGPAVHSSGIKHEKDEPSDRAFASGTGDSDDDDALKNVGERERPLRRKRRVKGQKICGVCGDLAQSYNFGALTCETCKAFFRRNAYKMKELQACVSNGSCTITKATRRFCASCRLKKCYTVGMNPDLILDDEERKERRRKRDLASARRQVKQEPTESSTSTETVTSPSNSKASCSSSAGEACFHGKLETGSAAEAYNASEKEKLYVGTVDRAVGTGPVDCVVCRQGCTRGHRFLHATSDQLPRKSNLYWPLTPQESSLLEHFTTCYRDIFWVTSSCENKAPINLRDLPVEKVMISVDLLLRKFVTFSKRVPEFRQLAEADQMTLLKDTAMRLYCVRLAEAYVTARRSWKTQVGEVSESEVAHLFKEPNILKAIVDFSSGVKFVVMDDTTVYALMHILVLFDPRDANLGDPAVVNSCRDKYMVLLKHHLEARFSFLHADRYLAEIVQVILEVDQLGQKLVNFFSDYSSHFYPLIAEFLNQ